MQKAVVVVTDSPQRVGQLREKLSVVTSAWFAQRYVPDEKGSWEKRAWLGTRADLGSYRNFSDVDILRVGACWTWGIPIECFLTRSTEIPRGPRY